MPQSTRPRIRSSLIQEHVAKYIYAQWFSENDGVPTKKLIQLLLDEFYYGPQDDSSARRAKKEMTDVVRMMISQGILQLIQLSDLALLRLHPDFNLRGLVRLPTVEVEENGGDAAEPALEISDQERHAQAYAEMIRGAMPLVRSETKQRIEATVTRREEGHISIPNLSKDSEDFLRPISTSSTRNLDSPCSDNKVEQSGDLHVHNPTGKNAETDNALHVSPKSSTNIESKVVPEETSPPKDQDTVMFDADPFLLPAAKEPTENETESSSPERPLTMHPIPEVSSQDASSKISPQSLPPSSCSKSNTPTKNDMDLNTQEFVHMTVGLGQDEMTKSDPVVEQSLQLEKDIPIMQKADVANSVDLYDKLMEAVESDSVELPDNQENFIEPVGTGEMEQVYDGGESQLLEELLQEQINYEDLLRERMGEDEMRDDVSRHGGSQLDVDDTHLTRSNIDGIHTPQEGSLKDFLLPDASISPARNGQMTIKNIIPEPSGGLAEVQKFEKQPTGPVQDMVDNMENENESLNLQTIDQRDSPLFYSTQDSMQAEALPQKDVVPENIEQDEMPIPGGTFTTDNTESQEHDETREDTTPFNNEKNKSCQPNISLSRHTSSDESNPERQLVDDSLSIHPKEDEISTPGSPKSVAKQPEHADMLPEAIETEETTSENNSNMVVQPMHIPNRVDPEGSRRRNDKFVANIPDNGELLLSTGEEQTHTPQVSNDSSMRNAASSLLVRLKVGLENPSAVNQVLQNRSDIEQSSEVASRAGISSVFERGNQENCDDEVPQEKTSVSSSQNTTRSFSPASELTHTGRTINPGSVPEGRRLQVYEDLEIHPRPSRQASFDVQSHMENRKVLTAADGNKGRAVPEASFELEHNKLRTLSASLHVIDDLSDAETDAGSTIEVDVDTVMNVDLDLDSSQPVLTPGRKRPRVMEIAPSDHGSSIGPFSPAMTPHSTPNRHKRVCTPMSESRRRSASTRQTTPEMCMTPKFQSMIASVAPKQERKPDSSEPWLKQAVQTLREQFPDDDIVTDNGEVLCVHCDKRIKPTKHGSVNGMGTHLRSKIHKETKSRHTKRGSVPAGLISTSSAGFAASMLDPAITPAVMNSFIEREDHEVIAQREKLYKMEQHAYQMKCYRENHLSASFTMLEESTRHRLNRIEVSLEASHREHKELEDSTSNMFASFEDKTKEAISELSYKFSSAETSFTETLQSVQQMKDQVSRLEKSLAPHLEVIPNLVRTGLKDTERLDKLVDDEDRLRRHVRKHDDYMRVKLQESTKRFENLEKLVESRDGVIQKLKSEDDFLLERVTQTSDHLQSLESTMQKQMQAQADETARQVASMKREYTTRVEEMLEKFSDRLRESDKRHVSQIQDLEKKHASRIRKLDRKIAEQTDLIERHETMFPILIEDGQKVREYCDELGKDMIAATEKQTTGPVRERKKEHKSKKGSVSRSLSRV